MKSTLTTAAGLEIAIESDPDRRVVRVTTQLPAEAGGKERPLKHICELKGFEAQAYGSAVIGCAKALKPGP